MPCTRADETHARTLPNATMRRASEHIFCLSAFACVNCILAGVPDHMPLLDIGCAFGISWATLQLSRSGGSTTVRAAMTLMAARWVSSVASVLTSPLASTEAKTFAVCVQLLGFCTLLVL